MDRRVNRASALLLTLALLLSLAACGVRKDLFASMHLVKTEGTVQVADAAGKSVRLISNLGLYSGYGVTTQAQSYGWILLDAAKLAKLDERSGVEVRKSGKELELYVSSGALFFNVTEPLADDETMNIRTSSMVVGIRGTCGWVEVEDESLMCVYLLRGKVECTVLDESGGVLATETITAGEAAKLVRADGEGSITVAQFDEEKAPAFVQAETEGGLDFFQGETGNDLPAGGPEVDAALAEYRTIVSRADTYYENADPNSAYRYALVQMQTEYDVPALLLKQIPQNTIFESSNIILLFQYDPNTGAVTRSAGHYPESSDSSLTMAGDGNGLFNTSNSHNGDSITSRVTLISGDIIQVTLWEERSGAPDWTVTDIGHLRIEWYSVDDSSGLNGWTSIRSTRSSS